MVNKKLLVYGSIIFILFFGIQKDNVGNRIRKKITMQVKKWLAINGKNNPDIPKKDYVQLVKDSAEIIASIHDTMSLEAIKKINHIDPAKFLTGLLKRVPELEVLELDPDDLTELESLYAVSNLGFPTLMF